MGLPLLDTLYTFAAVQSAEIYSQAAISPGPFGGRISGLSAASVADAPRAAAEIESPTRPCELRKSHGNSMAFSGIPGASRHPLNGFCCVT